MELSEEELQQRERARASLLFPTVTFDGLQARAIGRGFSRQCRTSNYAVWACSILPQHTHLVIARHTYKVEQIANLLKGAATRQLLEENRHPLTRCVVGDERPPRMWAEHLWKVYLDSEQAIENAIAYVEQNPIEEGKPAQYWSFVTPFSGLDSGHVTYH